MDLSSNDTNPMVRPRIAETILECVGATPLVRLNRLASENGVVANILLKLESFEPCKSVKERIAKNMIEEAEARGDIIPGVTTIIEGTSGNTGIGLAMVAAAKGYDCIIVMPETMSLERKVMLKALGAKLILTDKSKGIRGIFEMTEHLAKQYGDKGWVASQFENKDNPKTHRETTGPEIWYQTEGKVDIFVSGVGSGGTLTGCTQFLRTKNPDLQVIALEPEDSAVLSGCKPGPHGIQGIGAGIIPENCDTTLFNEIMQISTQNAIDFSRNCAKKEGIFMGISSGAAVYAAVEIGRRPENAGKTIVAIIPSFGERYLSTPLFADLQAEVAAQEVESVDV